MDWVTHEVESNFKAKVLWTHGDLSLTRVDCVYRDHPQFVVGSAHGDELFDDGQAAMERVRELRRELS